MPVLKTAAEFGGILVIGDLNKSCLGGIMGIPDCNGLRNYGRQKVTNSTSGHERGKGQQLKKVLS
jgi:hypothetical protein